MLLLAARLLDFGFLVVSFAAVGPISLVAIGFGLLVSVGRKIARQNAVQKIWPLMGYELRSKLQGAA